MPVRKTDRLVINGGDGKIRTPDQLVRSQVLYPTELHPRIWVRRDDVRWYICSILQPVKLKMQKT